MLPALGDSWRAFSSLGSKMRRRMPGVIADSGLTITRGKSDGPFIEYVMAKMPSPRRDASS
ncbi:MAG: hypothetical protein QM754_08455 [Tepidisphaeraceae bacterium]